MSSTPKKLIGLVYHRLRPESLRVKTGNRLVKLSSHQMEFFILNFMIALLREITTFKIKEDLPGFETADSLAAVGHYPAQVMPEYRKQRQYISSILAKNEIVRQDPYNRQIFLRIRRGYYIINPLLEIEYEGEWRNIYGLTHTSELENSPDPQQQYFGHYLRNARAQIAEMMTKTAR